MGLANFRLNMLRFTPACPNGDTLPTGNNHQQMRQQSSLETEERDVQRATRHPFYALMTGVRLQADSFEPSRLDVLMTRSSAGTTSFLPLK